MNCWPLTQAGAPAAGHAWLGPRGCERRIPEAEAALAAAGFFVQAYDERNPTAYSLRNGFPNHTWVEVTRVGSVLTRPANGIHAKRDSMGVWFWHAAGSGVWLGLGRTYVDNQPGRGERYYFTLNGGARARALAAEGYDTLQFPLTVRNSQFPMRNNRFEIAVLRPPDVRQHVVAEEDGRATCAIADNRLRSGWNAQSPCTCSRDQGVLACS